MTEFVLVLSQQNSYLYRLARNAAELVAETDENEDLNAWLSQHFPIHAYCSVVSDLMDESYVQSNIPAIWLPGTRKQLVNRRLTQLLRDSPYRAAVFAPTGSWRPPTRASLIGIGQPSRVKQWVNALIERQGRIKGLWPLSALIALALAKKPTSTKKETSENPPIQEITLPPTLALIATPAGLRQVLIRGRAPLFSRLALNTSSLALTATGASTEAQRTVQYLIAQSWLSSTETPLVTNIWLNASAEQTQDDIEGVHNLIFQPVSHVSDSYAELLPLLKRVSLELQCLPQAYRTTWRATQIARNVKLIGYGSLAASVVWSGFIVLGAFSEQTKAQKEVQEAIDNDKKARQEVLQAKGDISQAGLAVATVNSWKSVFEAQPDQLGALQHLSLQLKNTPSIEINTLRWNLPNLVVQAEGAAAQALTEPLLCPQNAEPDTLPAATTALSTTASITKVSSAKNEVTAPADTENPGKTARAMLSFSAVLGEELSIRQATDAQEKLRSSLSTNGWQAFIQSSTAKFDPSQVQLGVLGEKKGVVFEICMHKILP